MTPRWNHLNALAQAEINATLGALPKPLRARACQLPVTCEARPNAALVADGVEEDTLGLFVGEAFPDSESGALQLPAQIILFLENVWELAEEDEVIYREEIRTTLLHELGHYLGLDEIDLEERGLD